jgi:exodeoxyribonuclease V gamma subunit
MQLFHSAQIEPLLQHLAQRLSTPLDDPFTPELVVVPSGDMARYLKRELARTLGAKNGNDGIVSNINFVYPRQLVNATLQNPTGSENSEWDSNSLIWSIIDTLLTTDKITIPGFNETPITVARRAADLLDRYASHRPEMLNEWITGGVNDGKLTSNQLNTISKEQKWQRELFIELAKKFAKDPFSPRALDDLKMYSHALHELPNNATVPQRVSVFGITTLSRSARQILHILDQVSDIHIYMVYAAGDHWPTPCTPNQLLRNEFPETSISHPLTRRWGTQLIENAALFGDVQRVFLPIEPTETSLLHDLQKSIISDSLSDANLSPEQRNELRANSDGSFQIHACYGIARQAEALRDSFLHILDRNPQLQLRDCAILCADVDAAAPIISAVFAPDRSSESSLPSLPISLVGNVASRRTAVVESFLAVLQLLTSRCSPTVVLEVAHLPAVKRTFGLDDESLMLLSIWAEDLGVRFGLDAELRAAHWNISPDIREGTWDAALNRLMMGIAVPGEVDRVGPGDLVPYDGISGNEMRVAGSVAEFIERIIHFTKIIYATDENNKKIGITVSNFCSTIYELIDSFLTVPSKESSTLTQLHRAIRNFQSDVEKSMSQVDQTFQVNELVLALDGYFNDERSLLGSTFEAITVAPLDGLQHIPFQVLAILGADERSFAGAHSDGDDILANNPCVGEPLYSLDGRQRLLNAIMSARNTLIITCTGADISNNKETPLAVALQELLECTDVLLHEKQKSPYGSQRLIARHPRQNFDAATLTPGLVYADKPFTFDHAAKEAHDILQHKPDLPTTPPDSADEALSADTAPTLKNLVQVITNPTEFYVGTVLKARIPQMPSTFEKRDTNISGDGILNLTIDALSWSIEGRSLLDRLYSAHVSNEEVISAWEKVRPATGVIPPNELGKLIVKEIREEIQFMVNRLPEHLRILSKGTDIDCNITLPESKLNCSMRIQNVTNNAITRIRYKNFNESLLLEPWLELAILTLEKKGDYCEAHLVTRNKKKTDEPIYRKIVLAGDTTEERLSHAYMVISRSEGMYNAALNGTPPYFETASFELSNREKKKARAALANDLAYSPETSFVFGDLDIEDIFGEALTEKDFTLLHREQEDSNSATTRAHFYADHVWKAFLKSASVFESEEVEPSTDLSDGK